MNILAQLLVNGLIAGGNYALAAIGYTMVYSILRFINFAHGAVCMVGAYIVFVLAMTGLKINLIVALVLGMLLTALLGVSIEKVAYKPLRQAPKLATLTTAIAISFVLEAGVMIVWGADIKTFQLPVVKGWQVGPALITPVQLIIIASSVVFMLCLYFWLTRTRLGKAIRAVADGLELAEIIGINTDRIISVVFAIGSALAAASGTLMGLDTTLHPTMGFIITIKAFAAVILGGLGNLYGAIVGGFIIGLVENIGVWYLLGGDARWKDSIAYGILILALLFRPGGILGSKEGARVL
jgi:branched-subunit amino acid ABC-type transport system permease component